MSRIEDRGLENSDKEEHVTFHRMLRIKFDPLELTDSAFMKHFHITKPIFLNILSEIAPTLKPMTEKGLSTKDMLTVTMKFLAEASDIRYGTEPTFTDVLSKTLKVLEDICGPKWIQLRMTATEQQEAQQDFLSKYGIHNAALCVGNMHVRIIPPDHVKYSYFNSKGFYSLNALLICDHKMRFRYVNATYRGAARVHDIWLYSKLDEYFAKQHSEGNTGIRVVGNSLYPHHPWILKPKRKPLPYT